MFRLVIVLRIVCRDTMVGLGRIDFGVLNTTLGNPQRVVVPYRLVYTRS